MVNYTPNLNLAKPTLSDVADITVISNNFDILDSALAKMVTTDSPQEITGSKIFSGVVSIKNNNDDVTQPSGFQQSFYRYRDKNNNDAGLIGFEHFENGDKSIRLALMDNSKNYKLVDIFNVKNDGSMSIGGVTPSVNALNDKTIPTMEYLNSESKATYLVHRAGAETITGQKTFDNTSNTYKGNSIDIRRVGYGNCVIAGRRDYNISDIITNLNMGFITFHDAKDDVSGYVESYVNKQGMVAGENTPYSKLALMSRSPNQTYTKGIEIYSGDNGNAYINGITPSPNAPSTALVTKGEVYGTGNISNNLVHTISDESIGGNKVFTGIVRFDGFLDNQYWGKTCGASGTWQKVYEYDGSGTQYRSGAFIVMQRRNVTRNGILLFINNRNANPQLKWLVKTENIVNSDFVVTKEGNAITIWVKSTGSTSDGYQFMKMIESASSDCGSDIFASTDSNAYTITNTGYDEVVSGQTVHHTFSAYVESI